MLRLPDHLKGRSRSAATSKMERFAIIVNGWKPLTIIKKQSILDVAAALDPPLHLVFLPDFQQIQKCLIKDQLKNLFALKVE